MPQTLCCLSQPSATLGRWMHLVVTLGWDILPVSDKGCSETSSTLLLSVNGDGKSAVPYFWCLLSSLQQCSRMIYPLEGIQTVQLCLLSHVSTWEAEQLLWLGATPALPLLNSLGHVGLPGQLRGQCPDCGTSTGHMLQSAERATKPRQGQWKGAGNPRMPFLKQPFFQGAGRVCSHCSGMGPRVARPAICSNLLECCI